MRSRAGDFFGEMTFVIFNGFLSPAQGIKPNTTAHH
jgi:hypothetical protein